MGDNGHSNGQAHQGGNGGVSAPQLAAYCTEPSSYGGRRKMIGAMIAMIDEHGAKGIPIPDELVKAIPMVIAGLMQETSPRYRGLGAQLSLVALRYNLTRVEFVDKAARLDNDEATERKEHTGEVAHRFYTIVPDRDG